MAITNASGTSWPWAISGPAFTSGLGAVLDAWRRMSPVEICGIRNSAVSRLAWVPFPAFAGPSRMMLITSDLLMGFPDRAVQVSAPV